MDQIVKEHFTTNSIKIMVGKGNNRDLIVRLLTTKIPGAQVLDLEEDEKS